jgi:hypothetical protein
VLAKTPLELKVFMTGAKTLICRAVSALVVSLTVIVCAVLPDVKLVGDIVVLLAVPVPLFTATLSGNPVWLAKEVNVNVEPAVTCVTDGPVLGDEDDVV